jgi:hypothetical protein
VQFALVELPVHAQRALKLDNFLKNKHHRNLSLFSQPMIVQFNKIMVLMQARHLVHKLKPPARQYEQACSVCKA